MNDPANSSDAELLASLSARDDLALAVLAGRHARPVYDFALRAALDRRRALDATVAVFRSLASVRPDVPARSVRSWLLNAVALEMLGANQRGPAAPDTPPDDPAFTAAAEALAPDAAGWAWEAALGLRLRDYCLVDLSVRRGLSVEDIERSVGGRSRVAGALSRAVGGFEEAYAAIALAARGAAACADLEAILARGRTRVAVRRETAAHAVTCERCRATLAGLPAAVDAFAALADVEPPPELPDRIFASGTGPAEAGRLSFAEAAPDSGAGPRVEATALAAASPDSAPEAAFEPGPPPSAQAGPQDPPGTVEAPGYFGSPADNSQRGGARTGLLAKLEAWFEPVSGRRLLWSYAALGAATALAVYLGVAVADSIRGGGEASGAVPLGSGLSVATTVPCVQTTTLASGESATVKLDAAALGGYEIASASVAPVAGPASAQLLTVRQDGPDTVRLTAAPVDSPAPRADEYRLRLELRRGNDNAVADCRVFVTAAVH